MAAGGSIMFDSIVACVTSVALAATLGAQRKPEQIRVGIIGLDTSHVVAFTRLINDPDASGDLADLRVVAAFPAGTEISASKDRVARFTEQVRGMGVEIVDSIADLLPEVDAVLLESVDGRSHLEQVEPVFAAGKRVFIDKPLAGSLVDVLAIASLGRESGVPWFSSSSLRFGATVPESVGEVIGCEAWSPCPTEPTHPDLFWYGIHGVETLFTVMGPGCVRVSRVRTDGCEVVTGVWRDGRIGTFRGIRDGKRGYGATVFGTEGIAPRSAYPGYEPLVREVARFFKTGETPVTPEQTIEIYAFMAAAEALPDRDGAPVTIDAVLRDARAELARRR